MKPPMLDRWEGCYDLQWGGVITPQSVAHPAKFSQGLIRRIYQHCLDRGYLKKGDLIGDPFGGVGTGGVMAAYAGLRWVGVELEPRFVEWANDNFILHQYEWGVMKLPTPTILRGDSRQFDRIVSEWMGHQTQTDGVVCSPPFATQQTGGGLAKPDAVYGPDGAKFGKNHGYQNHGSAPGQIASLPEGEISAVVSSPPFAEQELSGTRRSLEQYDATGKHAPRNYADTSPGQIGRLPSGDLNAVVSSPPYSDIAAGQGGLNTKPPKHPGQQSGRNPKLASQNADQHYGQANGQIGRLAPGDLSAVVSSPPWEANAEGSRKGSKMGSPEKILNCNRGHGASDAAVLAQAARDEQKVYGDSPGQIGRLKGGQVDGVCTSPPYQAGLGHANDCPDKEIYKSKGLSSVAGKQYGVTEGQIGREQSETYWSAMREVYAATFRAIRPGGVLVLVLKDYVKKGKRVPLADDTVTLCESLGFVLIERIEAMLVSETRHADLFSGEVVKTKSRKSFFRRLAEAKGSPKIDWEDVLIFSLPHTL